MFTGLVAWVKRLIDRSITVKHCLCFQTRSATSLSRELFVWSDGVYTSLRLRRSKLLLSVLRRLPVRVSCRQQNGNSLIYKVLTTTQRSYLHNSTFIFLEVFALHLWSHWLARPPTSSSLRKTDRSFQYASLVSGINFRLPSVDHALISPVLWVALPPSVPSTHHFHHPLPLHSFTPGLKLSFSTNPSHRSLSFSSSGLTPRIPRTVYRYFWAYPYLLCSLSVLHSCCFVL